MSPNEPETPGSGDERNHQKCPARHRAESGKHGARAGGEDLIRGTRGIRSGLGNVRTKTRAPRKRSQPGSRRRKTHAGQPHAKSKFERHSFDKRICGGNRKRDFFFLKAFLKESEKNLLEKIQKHKLEAKGNPKPRAQSLLRSKNQKKLSR